MKEDFDYQKATAVYQAELILAEARGVLDRPIPVTIPHEVATQFHMRAIYADRGQRAREERRTGILAQDQGKTAFTDLCEKFENVAKDGEHEVYEFAHEEIDRLGDVLIYGNAAYEIGLYSLNPTEERDTLTDAEAYVALLVQFKEKGGVINKAREAAFHATVELLRPWVHPTNEA